MYILVTQKTNIYLSMYLSDLLMMGIHHLSMGLHHTLVKEGFKLVKSLFWGDVFPSYFF